MTTSNSKTPAGPMIYGKLMDVMAEVQAVKKTDRNQAQHFNFRGIDAVVNAVGPALRKHRVVVVPEVISADYQTVETASKKTMGQQIVKVSYVFYAEDGSSVLATVVGEAFDAGDKATPKAMSVAFRTALLQALALPTDEPDPDSESYERAPQQRTQRRQQAPQQDRPPAENGSAGKSEADTARDELRAFCREHQIPMNGIVAEFRKGEHGELKDTTNAAAIRELLGEVKSRMTASNGAAK